MSEWKETERPQTSRRLTRKLAQNVGLSVWEGVTEDRIHTIVSLDLRSHVSCAQKPKTRGSRKERLEPRRSVPWVRTDSVDAASSETLAAAPGLEGR